MAIELIPKLRERARNCDLLLSISICRLLCRCRVYDEILMKEIVNRALENIDSLRHKDMEWICFTISVFYNISWDKTAKSLIFSIGHRLIADDRTIYQSTIIRCIEFLSLIGFHDRKLINWALSPATLKSAYGSINNYDNSIIHIDGFARTILAGSYHGNQLDTKDIVTLAKKNMSTEDSYYLNDIRSLLKLSEQDAKIIHALPHFNVPCNFSTSPLVA